ncbi:MAG: hypothetical protein ACOCWM_05600, partial [Cyclobacteriaceae bacterium]
MITIINTIYLNQWSAFSALPTFNYPMENIINILLTALLSQIIIYGIRENYKRRKRIKQLTKYLTYSLFMLKKPLYDQIRSIINFSRQISINKDDHITFHEVTSFNLDSILSIGDDNLFEILFLKPKLKEEKKGKLYNEIMHKLKYLSTIMVSLKESWHQYLKGYEKYRDAYNDNINNTGNLFNQMIFDELNSKEQAKDTFLEQLDIIRFEWINSAIENNLDMYVAKELYLLPVRKLCIDFPLHKFSSLLLSYINDCLFAIENIDE